MLQELKRSNDTSRNPQKRSAGNFMVSSQTTGMKCGVHRLLMLGAYWLALLLLPLSLAAQTWNWHAETVDKMGKFTSIAADKDGNIHLSYSDGGDVKYAFRPAGTDSKWFTMTLASGGAYTSLTLDSEGHPHICYTYRLLGYIHWDGSDWKKETIASDNAVIGYSCAIAIAVDGTPYISWYREKNADNTPYLHIKLAERQNGVWLVRTLDFDLQTGKWESMALDSNGSPILSFDAYVKGLLKYAYKVGDDWKVATVDFRGRTNDVYDVGMGNSIAIDRVGKPCISYEDGQDLKFAQLVGDTWKVEQVDAYRPLGSWVGYRTSLKFDSQGHPHIAYDSGGVLKHAYWNGQKWQIDILAPSGLEGYKYGSMTIAPHDTIYISYTDPDDGSLKVAIGEVKSPGILTGSAAQQKP
jgi:hypothetical protein